MTTGQCGQCKPGFFGDFCKECQCQNSLDGNVCDLTTGTCGLCKPGFFGQFCTSSTLRGGGLPTNYSIPTLALSLSLVPAGSTPVSVFPPFNTPRTLPAIGVIFSEAPDFDYDYYDYYDYTDYDHQATQAPADAQKAADALSEPAPATPVPPKSAPIIAVTPPTEQISQPPTVQPTKPFQYPLSYGFRVSVTIQEIECSQLGADCDYDDINYGQQVSDSRVRENGQCRRCDQIFTGRNFEYSTALEIIEDEFYFDFDDHDDIRKKRDVTAKNPSKFETRNARVLGLSLSEEEFLSAPQPICRIVGCSTSHVGGGEAPPVFWGKKGVHGFILG